MKLRRSCRAVVLASATISALYGCTSPQSTAAAWLGELQELSESTKAGQVSQLEWQAQVDRLFAQVDPTEFRRVVDFDRLTDGLKFRENGERSLRDYRLPPVEGLPEDPVFGHQVFALKKGQPVAPHGHYNMVTLFYVFDVQLHGRHFDRVEDQKDHMIVEPTIDDTFGPGAITSVSDYKDNVHWFTATTDRAFLFNVHVHAIDPHVRKHVRKHGREYIDPVGERLAGGLVKAPKLSYAEAYERYGVDHDVAKG